MRPRGPVASDLRHLKVHHVAFDNLRAHPELKGQCLALARRWLSRPDLASARPWLDEWERMLSEWSVERIAEVVLDPEGGQTLRQCSPLAPAITARERWAALEEANREIDVLRGRSPA